MERKNRRKQNHVRNAVTGGVNHVERNHQKTERRGICQENFAGREPLTDSWLWYLKEPLAIMEVSNEGKVGAGEKRRGGWGGGGGVTQWGGNQKKEQDKRTKDREELE